MITLRTSASRVRGRHLVPVALAAFISMALLMAYTSARAEDKPSEEAKTVTLVLPPGTYTSLVFTAIGSPNADAALAVLKVGTDQFPLSIGPGVTVAIPFGNGWVLEREALIVLSHTTTPPSAIAKAWAVTPSGPVALRPR